MAVWSSFSRSLVANSLQLSKQANSQITKKFAENVFQIRHMSDHGPKTFHITPSRFQWHKFKDTFHFYVMIGVIPVTAIILYANIFVGPATLTPTPEGYTPKHWEYYKHPITRFLARYIYSAPQQEYEKMCHFLFEEGERAALRDIERKVNLKMGERSDYQSYYYRPADGKYHRISKEVADELYELRGDN